TLATDVRGADVPEPSPLFWEHFSARVAQATATQKTAAPWWSLVCRPVGALTAAALIIGFAVVNAPRTKVAQPVMTSDPPVIASLPAISDEDGSWRLVVGLADEADWSDVRQAVTPADGTADA